MDLRKSAESEMVNSFETKPNRTNSSVKYWAVIVHLYMIGFERSNLVDQLTNAI